MMKGPNESKWTETDLPLDRLLTEGTANGCLVLLPTNERPPLGCAGMIDWRTHGAISSSIQAGIFTGVAGECGYLPWSFQNRTLHVLVAGIGAQTNPGTRPQVPVDSWLAIERNLKKLGPIQWAISRTEFSEKKWGDISGSLPQGGALWISA
ncbi:hypothetical protein EBZ37_06720 [bacterium]|nr:hypothetical protein [bacterium]